MQIADTDADNQLAPKIEHSLTQMYRVSQVTIPYNAAI